MNKSKTILSTHAGGVRKAFFTTAALAAAMLCLSSCRTVQFVPVIETRTDTVEITRQQRDSIWLHDSIHVTERQSGDTIFLTSVKWHTKYIERETHDTIYVATHDTVPQTYPVEVEVEKKLTVWQQFRMSLGNVVLYAMLIGVVWFFLRQQW